MTNTMYEKLIKLINKYIHIENNKNYIQINMKLEHVKSMKVINVKHDDDIDR